MDSENTPSQFTTTGSSDQSLLPKEIIEKILLRLPVKSLLRLRCVSKSWLSMIDSELFIKNHLEYSTKNTASAHHKVVFNNHRELKQCSMHSLLNEPITNPSPFDDPKNILSELVRVVSVVGCCNGLVCILKQPGRFFSLNPSTRISMELPKLENRILPSYVMKSGFGWDESSGAYKVFAVVPNPKKGIGKLYSSKTNSWKTVEDMYLSYCFEKGQFVGGKLHWHRTGRDIVCFDLETEAFGMIEQPWDPEGCLRVSLGELGGCLSAVCDYPKTGIDVWCMKESWVKVITLPLVYKPREIRPFAAPLGLGPNGEILITYGSNFLVYCLKDNVLRPPKKIDGLREAYLYVESLVSPVLVPDKINESRNNMEFLFLKE